MVNTKKRPVKMQHFPQPTCARIGINICPLFVDAVFEDAVIFKRVETGQELRLELLDFKDCTSDFGVLVSDFIKSRLTDNAKGRPLVPIGDRHRTNNCTLIQRFRRSRDKLVVRLKFDGHEEMATALAKFRMRDLLGGQRAGVTPGLSDQCQGTHKQSYRNLTLAAQYLRTRNGN